MCAVWLAFGKGSAGFFLEWGTVLFRKQVIEDLRRSFLDG